jgi:hypothetical protein
MLGYAARTMDYNVSSYPSVFTSVPSLLYGAVQNGKLRNPGRKNNEGLGRSTPVAVRSDGPFTTVAVSVPRGSSLPVTDENDMILLAL